MKRWIVVSTLGLCAIVTAALVMQGSWRDALAAVRKPALPMARGYVAAVTSTNVVVLPKAINLAVPFLSQAPKQNWNLPYQEACEEAAMIMVDAYYRGRTKSFAPDEGDRAILDLIAFEERQKKTPDLTAQEAADLVPQYFIKRAAMVYQNPTAETIKRELAAGRPVIVPASGKALKNPNFKNGGPLYHMLVIKGYLADGRWITNDAGTRRGADYVYNKDVLLRAIHDWNGGNVATGMPAALVITTK